MKKTLIIAEAGVNHNGDINLARELIDAAVFAGADIVKFQSFNSNSLTTSHAYKAKYQEKFDSKDKTQKTMLQKLELNKDQHNELVEYCQMSKIEFLSTAFDDESLELIHSYNLKRYKIPSGEITNIPFLRKIAVLKKPIILSTGMSHLGEIEIAINTLENSGISRSQITVLHCTTEYPAPINEVNIKAMRTISKSFNVNVGYSDHTEGILIPIAAVALGASIIEKHLTLNCNLPGPDHKASLEPNKFKEMVDGIRNIEKALGDGIKRPTKSEIKNIASTRKSIVAAISIKKGDVFTQENLTTKRPGTGISPLRFDEYIGTISVRDYKKDDLIQ